MESRWTEPILETEDPEATWTEPVPTKEEIIKLIAQHKRQCTKLKDSVTTTSSLGLEDAGYYEAKEHSVEEVMKRLKALKKRLVSGDDFSMIFRGKVNTTYRACSDGVKRLTVKDINKRYKPEKKGRGKMLAMVKCILKSFREKTPKTQRRMYYHMKNVALTIKGTKKGTKKQTDVYDTLDDICCDIMCTRSSIYVNPCVKGFVGGLLLWRQNGHKFDAQSREDGMLIPNMRSEPVLENCGAEFILVVEKHSVFVDLREKKFYNDYPCIIVTGVGTPGMTDRRFLKLLGTLGLPMYGLFDGDVGGIRIFSNYAFGTHEKAFDSVNLTCPHMTWLGVWPTDISKLDVRSEKLSVHENGLLDGLLKEEFVTEEDNPRLFQELKYMKRTQRKANLEALEDKYGPNWTNFLPYQIKRVLTEKSTD